VPDTALPDGKTAISFAPGALSNAGTLVVRQLDLLKVPSGPGGLLPIVVYEFQLEGTTLLSNAGVTLSYPSNPDGSIIGTNGSAANLALYWLQGFGWQILGPRQWDSSLHTLSANSSHFSTFALFLSGATTAADLRPQ